MKKVLVLLMLSVSMTGHAQFWKNLGKIAKGVANTMMAEQDAQESNVSSSSYKESKNQISKTKTSSNAAKVLTPVRYDFLPIAGDSIKYIEPLLGTEYNEDDIIAYMPAGSEISEERGIPGNPPYLYTYPNAGYRYIVTNHKVLGAVFQYFNSVDKEKCLEWFKQRYKENGTEDSLLGETYLFKNNKLIIRVVFQNINGIESLHIAYMENV